MVFAPYFSQLHNGELTLTMRISADQLDRAALDEVVDDEGDHDDVHHGSGKNDAIGNID